MKNTLFIIILGLFSTVIYAMEKKEKKEEKEEKIVQLPSRSNYLAQSTPISNNQSSLSTSSFNALSASQPIQLSSKKGKNVNNSVNSFTKYPINPIIEYLIALLETNNSIDIQALQKIVANNKNKKMQTKNTVSYSNKLFSMTTIDSNSKQLQTAFNNGTFYTICSNTLDREGVLNVAFDDLIPKIDNNEYLERVLLFLNKALDNQIPVDEHKIHAILEKILKMQKSIFHLMCLLDLTTSPRKNI